MARILIPLAQGCEELEAVTVIDLLRRAKFEVATAGLSEGPVTASRGTVLIPDTQLELVKNDEFDMIVLPGGLPGADNLNNSQIVHEVIRRLYENNAWTAAICAAPRVFARAGILENRNYTCFPDAVNPAEAKGIHQQAAVVVDGKIITSRGPGTAMDFALTLIEQLGGAELRTQVEGPLVRS